MRRIAYPSHCQARVHIVAYPGTYAALVGTLANINIINCARASPSGPSGRPCSGRTHFWSFGPDRLIQTAMIVIIKPQFFVHDQFVVVDIILVITFVVPTSLILYCH